MYLSSSRLEHLENKSINSLLENIRSSLNEEIDEFSNRALYSASEYRKIVQDGKGSMKMSNLFLLLNTLDININSLVDGNFDFDTFCEHKNGNRNYIPKKYSIAAFSRKRNIVNVFNCVKQYYPYISIDELFNYFQIDSSVFKDENDFINLKFCSDVFSYLRIYGFKDNDYVKCGHYTSITNAGTPLARELSKEVSPKKLYESYFTKHIGLIEKNCDYAITRLKDDECIVTATSKREVADMLDVKDVGSYEVCLQKVGALEVVLCYKGYPHAKVTHPKCIHSGNSECKFEINFSGVNH